MKVDQLNIEVTTWIEQFNHPFSQEIAYIRNLIFCQGLGLKESVKWNAPNYSVGEEDRMTLRIFPVKNLQIIFHRGVKVMNQDFHSRIQDTSGLLVWKSHDRAVVTFKSLEDIRIKEPYLIKIIIQWVQII